MNDPVLATHKLSKIYKNEKKALNNVSIEVARGEVYCLLGANGAGKTTLINCITGLVQPTLGTITIDEVDAWVDYRKARSKLALVPQEIMLDPFMTVMQTVKFARGFFGKKEDSELTKAVLEDLHLYEKRNAQVQELSGGMKRRVLIAKALMNEPALLFLDEPTAGVDVELRRGMWRTVEALKKQGMTIFLTTHYLEEAERYADTIGFMSHGILHFSKPKQELLDQYPGLSLEDIYLELIKHYE